MFCSANIDNILPILQIKDNKMPLIKEKILQYAVSKGFKKTEFPEKIGMTYSNFKGLALKTPINSDAISNILSLFPDINPYWLLTGNGEMLLPEGITQGEVIQLAINAKQGELNTGLQEQIAGLKKAVQEKNEIIEDYKKLIEGQDKEIALLKEKEMILFKLLENKLP